MGGGAGLSTVIEQTGDQTTAHVYQRLLHGSQQLWAVADGPAFVGSLITEVDQRDTGPVLVARYIAGERLDEWAGQLNDKLIAFARQHGCVGIQAIAREGGRKMMRANGWRDIAVVYWMDVDGL